MKIAFFILCLFITCSNSATNELDALVKERIKESANRFFESNDVLQISVKADFKAIRADRDRSTNEYHTASIEYTDGDDTLNVPVKIKTRGNFRLKEENCDFPPLRFKFKTRDAINTAFEGQDKLKLVTHCRDTSQTMQETMLREFLVYRLYNNISERSLRVRLVKVKYIDINYGEELNKYGFFIESIEQMAERLGLEEIEMANLTQEQLIEDNILQVALFNYMIGNTDWSIPKLHNVALLRDERHAPPIAVPYDFDMSEFVDACYMKVYMGRELIESRYKGKKVSIDALEKAIAHYQAKKNDLVTTVLEFEPLDLKSRQECIKLIDSFYHVLADRQAYRKAFIAEAVK
ncbi:hypothetical protein KDU71_10835 [Carboxylicivirga sediminis]|uniref:Uncharacterized protein n=1 Tax=Carboxylicivirga sediminis TaxID=2006564 RepID=A0A941IY02_9BACT|nr:hypothetical protein [Carboxylicivirga sediminis]MBR8536053.1 hypothetical protein [Carboxylicivirga sediminis]